MTFAYPVAALDEIKALVDERFVSRRKHPTQPLWIYNYTNKVVELSPQQWWPALEVCRGLILNDHGEVIGRPFRKFWNYEQVLHQIPTHEDFTVWEKLDGSLGIVCSYRGELITATRGTFESNQAKWAHRWLKDNYPRFLPDEETYLFEVIYPENRIVVDYGSRTGLVLLAVMNRDETEDNHLFSVAPFEKAKRFDGLTDFSTIDSMPELDGQEGLVVRWQSGFRAKLKRADYRRLHRLITQCSNRTIWELLRANKSTEELLERVPNDFRVWATQQISEMRQKHEETSTWARNTYSQMNYSTRKEFAESAKKEKHPGLLFSLLDGRDITDSTWKLIEPTWCKPFKVDEQ